MKKSLRLYIQGAVQGLFFEQFILEHAGKNNIKGYMRKLEDGRVEIFLEGDNESVDAMKAICQRGPQHSNIKTVQEKSESFQGFKDFKIMRI